MTAAQTASSNAQKNSHSQPPPRQTPCATPATAKRFSTSPLLKAKTHASVEHVSRHPERSEGSSSASAQPGATRIEQSRKLPLDAGLLLHGNAP